MSPHFIRRLLFSGGGVRGVAFVGFLKELQGRNLLEGVREFCGVSAGAFISFLLVIGYSVETIHRLCVEFDFTILPSLEPENFLLFFEEFGVDDGQKLERLLRSFLRHRGLSQEITFGELAAIPGMKGLRVWATDIENLEMLEFSAKKTPNVDVCKALMASMAFPLYFKPVKHPETGCLLMDGGVMDNFPILFLTERERYETLGAMFVYNRGSKDKPNVSFPGIFTRIITGLRKMTTDRTYRRYKNNIVLIPCMEFSEMYIHATGEERQQIMDIAQEATRDFLERPQKVFIKRRHSVS